MTQPGAAAVAATIAWDQVIHGDALTVLERLPSARVDMVLTSPPYWNQRDYGVAGQLGLEPDFRDYLAQLEVVFGQVWRVLKPTGTCWVNLGDSYRSEAPVARRTGGRWQRPSRAARGRGQSAAAARLTTRGTGVKSKSLCNLPARFAIQMTNQGWLLRNEIIWHKPNVAPQRVTDRFTVDFEKLFFFTKSQHYYFEQQFEPARTTAPDQPTGQRRNQRATWVIPTSPFHGGHHATFPEALLEVPIRAGCPVGGLVLDPYFGAGTTGLVARRYGRHYLGIELNPEYVELARARLRAR